MDTVNENSTSYVAVDFRDKRNRLAVPTAVSYRIDCLTTGAQVKPWTAIDPAASVEIVITAAENAILGGNERERRVVSVIAAYGLGSEDQASDDFSYDVLNLQYVP